MTTKSNIEQLFPSNYPAMLTLAIRLLHDPEAAREQTAEHGAYELTMKDAGLTEDGEVIPDWDGEV